MFKENINEAGLNFNKAFYNADTKKITAAYYLIEDTEDTYKILNVKEKKDPSSRVYNDKTKFYVCLSEINEVILPKNIVNKLEEYPSQQGFFYFEMPYSFYKNNLELKVERINIAPNFKEIRACYGKTYRPVRDLITRRGNLYDYLIGSGLNGDDLVNII